jgi:hypothetical protein
MPISHCPQVDINLDETGDEFAQFEDLATEFKRTFPKLLDCVAHSLQLPLRKVIDTDPTLAVVRQKVFTLLKKFSKSETATRSLKQKCGLKLVLPGITWWNSLCLTYDRLLKIRELVDQVCVERGWATLRELENVPKLLAEERFSHVIGFQERETEFNSTYLIATFLDPNTAYSLSSTEQKLAKRELMIMVSYLPVGGREGLGKI